MLCTVSVTATLGLVKNKAQNLWPFKNIKLNYYFFLIHQIGRPKTISVYYVIHLHTYTCFVHWSFKVNFSRINNFLYVFKWSFPFFKPKDLQTVCPISGHRQYTDHVSAALLLKGKSVKQIITIIRVPVDLHYKEQHVQHTYEFHQNQGWSLTGVGRLTHTQYQPCFNPPVKGCSSKTDERQDMQECLKFHVRLIDLGPFFHVLISPVNIWAEKIMD